MQRGVSARLRFLRWLLFEFKRLTEANKGNEVDIFPAKNFVPPLLDVSPIAGSCK
jgi:hypothetical protein